MRQEADFNEEFNNFMYRVNEVSDIVQKLKSDSRDLQKIGELEAERYLRDNDRTILENIDESAVQLKVVSDKTVINHQAFSKMDPPQDPNQMSQEAFKDWVEKDCQDRYKSKCISKEKADTFKTQALKAFRRGEFEKALNCYNKAIEQVRNSCALYLNRALTLINLGLYERAVQDIKNAQRMNEDSLKSWLLLAKAHHLSGKPNDFEEAVREAKERNKDKLEFIEEYVKDLLETK